MIKIAYNEIRGHFWMWSYYWCCWCYYFCNYFLSFWFSTEIMWSWHISHCDSFFICDSNFCKVWHIFLLDKCILFHLFSNNIHFDTGILCIVFCALQVLLEKYEFMQLQSEPNINSRRNSDERNTSYPCLKFVGLF